MEQRLVCRAAGFLIIHVLMKPRPMDQAICLWVPLLGVLFLVLHAAVPIHRVPPWQDVLENAILISPIRMVLQQA